MSRLLYVPVLAGLLTTSTLIAQATPPADQAAAKTAAKAVEPPSVGYARLSGVYADLPEVGADLASVLLGGGGKPKSFYGLLDSLREFAAGGKSSELLLDLTDAFSMNGAQVMEMERCLRGLRKSGLKIYAYLEGAGSVQMQIAAQCDRVILADMGVVEIPSAALSVMFMKDAMDLLGIQMDVVRCGDFKGAVEPYVLSEMSAHLKQHYRKMLTKINEDTVRRIATGRGMAMAKVRQLQAGRIVDARQALAAGLVDDLVPWIGAKEALARIQGGKQLRFTNAISKQKRKSINFFTLMSNLLNPKDKADAKIEGGMVVLHLSGAIVDGSKPAPGSIVSGPTVKVIRQVAKDANVKAVVVRINSPGGSATASEAIVLALKELAANKPVAFSMGRVAASGGYYVTCIGRPILAEAATITGSIGVFGMKPNLGPLMRRIGIHEELVGLDESAGFGSMNRGWSPEMKAKVQGFVNGIYDRFTGHVSASRKIPVADVLKIAGGRVWSGEQAVANGLVDKIGGLDAAMAMVAAEAGLEAGYKVTHLPEPVNPVDALMQSLVGVRAALPDATLQLLGKRSAGLDRALRVLLDALTNERPTRVWMMMPESFELR